MIEFQQWIGKKIPLEEGEDTYDAIRMRKKRRKEDYERYLRELRQYYRDSKEEESET